MRIILTEIEMRYTQPVEGRECMLIQVVDELSGDRWYRIRYNCSDGVPGLLDSSIKRYHGWRGTYNNHAIYAEGLHRIEKISQCKNGNAWITVSKDLKPNEP